MRMTVDDSIKYLTAMRKTCQADTEMLSIAINAMRKYQKIEQILDDCDLEAWEILEKIKEVVENGNVDC